MKKKLPHIDSYKDVLEDVLGVKIEIKKEHQCFTSTQTKEGLHKLLYGEDLEVNGEKFKEMDRCMDEEYDDCYYEEEYDEDDYDGCRTIADELDPEEYYNDDNFYDIDHYYDSDSWWP